MATCSIFWYPWLWAWGGKEVETDCKTVALDSPETLAAVTNAVELFKNGLIDGVLAWTKEEHNRPTPRKTLLDTKRAEQIQYQRRTQCRQG